jgi:hypothetical protein
VPYNARAEPAIGHVAHWRPSYIPRLDILGYHAAGACRRTWTVGGTVTSLELSDGTIVRPLEEWGARSDLEAAAGWWTARGYKAASPAGLIFQAAFDWYRRPAKGTHVWAAGWVRGAWEEASVRGVIAGPHRMYDLRRAYRWALTMAPLPDRLTMHAAREWCPHLPGLHAVDIEPWAGAPWPLRDGGRVLVETPLDVTLYGPPTVRSWHGGVTWHRWVPTTTFGDLLDSIGAKCVQRAYWGLWLASTPVRCDFLSGAVTWLAPYATDHVRAHLILQRVRRRLAEVNTTYRYVDAVLVTADNAPATGDGPGEWREVKRYDDGVWVGWPGAYGPVNAPPDRLAGIHRKVG